MTLKLRVVQRDLLNVTPIQRDLMFIRAPRPAAPAVPSYILREDGSFLLREDGFKILREA